jgi:tetratricopeptide (TPR) repeat protein
MVDEAESTFEAFAAEYPEHPNRPNLEVAFASARFDYDEAERAALDWRESVRGSPPQEIGVLASLASIAGVRGKLNELQRLLLEAYDMQEASGTQIIPQPRELFEATIESLIDLWFLNSPDGAVARLDRVRRELGYSELPLHQRDDLQLASIYARANSIERARELLSLYEQSTGQGESESDRSSALWAAYGTISITQQRFEDAIHEFSEARLKVPGCKICFLLELGEAYAGANQLDSAVAHYDRYLSTPTLNRLQMDNFNLWAVLIGAGHANEALGREEEAVEAYNRLLELWQDADPEMQGVVEDVRARIARLVAEGA